VDVVRRVTGGTGIAERFPQFRERLARRLPTLAHANRQQIELLRRHRAAGDTPSDDYLPALLLSINCIAAGFGTTG
jgi:phosphoenolpyruvate carboxylase